MPGFFRASITIALLFCSFGIRAHALLQEHGEESPESPAHNVKIPPPKGDPSKKSLAPKKSAASRANEAQKASVKPNALQKRASSSDFSHQQKPVNARPYQNLSATDESSNQHAAGGRKAAEGHKSGGEVHLHEDGKSACEQRYSSVSAQQICEKQEKMKREKK
jgi:hypothetical protein